jgi:hypothetical protein
MQTFGIPKKSQNFYPFNKKMQNTIIIYERNAYHLRLKYTWLGERFYMLDTWRTDDSSIKYIYSHPKNDNKIGPKYSLSQNNKKHHCNIFS